MIDDVDLTNIDNAGRGGCQQGDKCAGSLIESSKNRWEFWVAEAGNLAARPLHSDIHPIRSHKDPRVSRAVLYTDTPILQHVQQG